MAGLFTAALLQKAGHDVVVHERSRQGLEGRGAGLVAQHEVFALLHAIGRDDVADVGVTARDRVVLNREGIVAHRDATPQRQISWDHLYDAVRSLLDGRRYRIGNGVIAAGEDDDKGWLDLEDGTRFEADLIVGADGIGSTVRRAVTGMPPEPHYAGYVAWRALIPETGMPAAAHGTLSDRFAFFDMQGGQVLGYTVPGPQGELASGRRRYNCVWYRRVEDLDSALTDRDGRVHSFSLPPGGVSKNARDILVADARALLPPPFAEVFAAEQTPFVQAVFDMVTSRMATERMVLIGDSAFVARPHTAMGVAKAAGDALALEIAVARGWSPDARDAFEEERLTVGSGIVAYGQRLGAALGT